MKKLPMAAIFISTLAVLLIGCFKDSSEKNAGKNLQRHGVLNIPTTTIIKTGLLMKAKTYSHKAHKVTFNSDGSGMINDSSNPKPADFTWELNNSNMLSIKTEQGITTPVGDFTVETLTDNSLILALGMTDGAQSWAVFKK